MYSLSGSLDTKRSHVTLSLHAWVHARSPLEFCHQADVVARPLRVRQAAVLGANFALARQLEHAHRCKGIFCVEDVIQGAVEVLRAVREQGLTDHVDAVALALRGADAEAVGRWPGPPDGPLATAAALGHVATMDALLEAGASANAATGVETKFRAPHAIDANDLLTG